MRGMAAAGILLAMGSGCDALMPAAEDVATRYRLHDPDGFSLYETRRVAITWSREFHEKGTLDDLSEGTIHWVTDPESVKRLVRSMSFVPVENDASRKRALCLLFFPDDAVSRTQIELDENLDMHGHLVRHGDTLAGPDWETSQEFKVEILRAIGSCPRCRDYLGIRPPTRASGDEHRGPARELRSREVPR